MYNSVMEKQRPKRYPIRISEETHRRLKTLASLAGRTVEQYAGDIVAEFVERESAKVLRK